MLVDVFPLKNNRHWHLTAGFYLDPSKFAEAKNSTESMISLVSASIYNKMYESAVNGGNLIDFNNIPSLSGSGIVMPDAVRDKFLEYGDMGFEVGQFSHDFTDEAGNVLKDANGNTIDKGRAYIVQPDEDCLVRVSASSKSFKPYVGFGYSGRLLKSRDDWKISFDCGAMFWGGTPDLVVHHGLKLKDGTYRDVSLINDVENIGDLICGKVYRWKLSKFLSSGHGKNFEKMFAISNEEFESVVNRCRTRYKNSGIIEQEYKIEEDELFNIFIDCYGKINIHTKDKIESFDSFDELQNSSKTRNIHDFRKDYLERVYK